MGRGKLGVVMELLDEDGEGAARAWPCHNVVMELLDGAGEGAASDESIFEAYFSCFLH
jgi:hypothetical protein